MQPFEYFKSISKIPRGSGNEAQIAEYLCDFAKENELFYVKDENNNVFIRREAASGFEDKAPVLLQAHTDMVCESASGVAHDFQKDPIELVINGDVVTANGTTLGADDGAGVAVMMDILADKELKAREIECLFTSSEETGMEGAFGFDYSQINSELMVNLDSEEELNACIGCAGGMRSNAFIPMERVKASGTPYTITITGLAGGHSGTEIDRGRRSALKIMGELLDRLYNDYPLHVVEMTGGGRDNVIPFTASVTVIFYSDSDAKTAKVVVKEFAKLTASMLRDEDKGFRMSIKKAEKTAESMLSLKSTSNLISALLLAPQGVTESISEKNIVVASVNMGSFELGDKLKLGFLIRSGNLDFCRRTANVISRMAHVLGGEAEIESSYPGWDFRLGGAMQKAYKAACLKIYGKEPKFTVIHAGLECGVISSELQKYGKSPDIISIGPDVHDIHTPEERMSISSLSRMCEIVRYIIEE